MRRLLLQTYILFFALTAMACQNNEVEATPSVNSSNTMYITINEKTVSCKLVDNTSTQALLEKLSESDISYTAHDYGNFEKVGDIGISLPQNNESITTVPGDVILYQGDNICLYYDTNTWSFTRLGKIEGMTQDEIKAFLNAGGDNVVVRLSLQPTTDVKQISLYKKGKSNRFSLDGKHLQQTSNKGVYIENGKKIVKR